MTLVYSLRTGALIGQRCDDPPGLPAGMIRVLRGASTTWYSDVERADVRLEVVR